MFNLEQAIAVWRWHMLAAGVKNPDVLDELESHLREEIERQTNSGLNESEAFESAILQIGRASLLKAEFAKAEMNELRERKIARFFLALAALTYLLCGTFGLLHGEMTAKERLLGFTAVFVSVLSLFLGVRYGHKLFPVVPHRRSRFAIQVGVTLAVVLWATGYFYLILPHCDFTMGQLVVATLWAMTPFAIVGGITNGMDEVVYRQNALAES